MLPGWPPCCGLQYRTPTAAGAAAGSHGTAEDLPQGAGAAPHGRPRAVGAADLHMEEDGDLAADVQHIILRGQLYLGDDLAGPLLARALLGAHVRSPELARAQLLPQDVQVRKLLCVPEQHQGPGGPGEDSASTTTREALGRASRPGSRLALAPPEKSCPAHTWQSSSGPSQERALALAPRSSARLSSRCSPGCSPRSSARFSSRCSPGCSPGCSAGFKTVGIALLLRCSISSTECSREKLRGQKTSARQRKAQGAEDERHAEGPHVHAMCRRHRFLGQRRPLFGVNTALPPSSRSSHIATARHLPRSWC